MTARDGTRFDNWHAGQLASEGKFLAMVARLAEWREADLAACKAEYEQSVERTWRTFHDGVSAVFRELANDAADSERYWLQEIKPGHVSRSTAPELSHDGDQDGDVRSIEQAAPYPGAIPLPFAPDDEPGGGHDQADGGPGTGVIP